MRYEIDAVTRAAMEKCNRRCHQMRIRGSSLRCHASAQRRQRVASRVITLGGHLPSAYVRRLKIAGGQALLCRSREAFATSAAIEPAAGVAANGPLAIAAEACLRGPAPGEY